jgi:hypothetical protein
VISAVYRKRSLSGVFRYHNMPRKPAFVPTPSRLSQILAELKKEPRPQLTKLKGLKITYAYRNDHWGVRYVLLYFLLDGR